jgi:glycosyltransferase involved in cell wall biosynthesis
MIVDVNCEDGTTQIARTITESQDSYIVNFLEKNRFNLYDFTKVDEEVAKESVSGFYDVDELEETHLFAKHPQGYELIDDSDDEDFECSEDESSESEDESLVDEEEEEEA